MQMAVAFWKRSRIHRRSLSWQVIKRQLQRDNKTAGRAAHFFRFGLMRSFELTFYLSL
jgi:hypothetical protein